MKDNDVIYRSLPGEAPDAAVDRIRRRMPPPAHSFLLEHNGIHVPIPLDMPTWDATMAYRRARRELEVTAPAVIDPKSLEVGDIVRVTHVLRRERFAVMDSRFNRKWVPLELSEPELATVVGVRTYTNGHAWYDYDAGTEYEPQERFKVVLCVFDLYKNAMPCLPEHLELVRAVEPRSR